MKKTLVMFMVIIMVLATFSPAVAFADDETVTVTFDMNGREGNGGSPQPQTVLKGSKIQAPASPSADEVFDGYCFLNWYYKNEDNQTVKWNFEEDTVQSDLTLYADWVDYPVVNIKVTLDEEPYPGLALEYRSKTDESLIYTFAETSTGGTYQYNGVRPGSYKVYVNNEYFSADSFYPGVIESNESMKFYTVTFDANGQEFTEETAPASEICWFFALKSDNSVERPADPVAKAPNYRFVGWTVGPEPDSEAFDFLTESIKSKTVIYAQWDRIADEDIFPVTAERATIIGSSYAKRGEDYHATLVPTDGYELPFKFNSDSTSCTHIKIDGQMLNRNYYTMNLQTGELTIPGKYITGRVEIVTMPRQNPFIIHFSANGGTGTQEGEGAKVYDQQNGYAYAESSRPMGYYYLPSCTMTPPNGKMFSHWSLSSDGSYNNYDPGKCHWTFRDTTFYAVWKDAPEGTYTVAYDLTGCKFSGSTNASNSSDYTTVLTPKGEYEAPITLGSVQAGDKILDSSEYSFAKNSETGAFTLIIPADKITGNITITANAKPIRYSVTYKDGAGGNVFADEVHKDLIKGDDTPDFGGNLTRKNYEFDKWTPEVSAKVQGNAVYTAQWKPGYEVYAVYDDEDGETLVADGFAEAGTRIEALFQNHDIFDAYGYEHTEFYKDAACTQKYAADTVITAGMKLYVRYTTKYYDISVPITKTVVMGGSVAPGEAAFSFEICSMKIEEEDGNGDGAAASGVDDRFVYIPKSMSITTNGAAAYNETLTFKVSEKMYVQISDGFILREVAGSADGWEYDAGAYIVTYDMANNKVDTISKIITPEEVVPVSEAAFTNTYYGYQITAKAETGGTITPAGMTDVTKGASLSYTIKASDGYRISDVLVDGVSVGAVTDYPFTNIEKDHCIEVKTAVVSDSKPGDTTPGGTTPGGTTPGGTASGGTDVKTGDSGQIMLYLILMMAALAVGAGLLICRKPIHSKK